MSINASVRLLPRSLRLLPGKYSDLQINYSVGNAAIMILKILSRGLENIYALFFIRTFYIYPASRGLSYPHEETKGDMKGLCSQGISYKNMRLKISQDFRTC